MARIQRYLISFPDDLWWPGCSSTGISFDSRADHGPYKHPLPVETVMDKSRCMRELSAKAVVGEITVGSTC